MLNSLSERSVTGLRMRVRQRKRLKSQRLLCPKREPFVLDILQPPGPILPRIQRRKETPLCLQKRGRQTRDEGEPKETPYFISVKTGVASVSLQTWKWVRVLFRTRRGLRSLKETQVSFKKYGLTQLCVVILYDSLIFTLLVDPYLATSLHTDNNT